MADGSRSSSSTRVFLVHCLLLSAPAGTLAWVLREMTATNPSRAAWTLAILITVAFLFSAYWMVVHTRHHWSKPTKRLVDLLREVRDSEAAIDELSSIDGGIAAIVPLIQETLRDLRRRRSDLAELEHEMRQRVAMRTDALERKIGSLQVLATRDVLSGLFNRRALEQDLPRAVARYKADNADTCLLMIDVDNFKLLNDSLGHAAGDQLLKEIGQLIRSTIREDDLAFRCGGDEFVILLADCNLATGRSMTERLESLVLGLTRPLRLTHPPQLSIGACALSELENPTPQSLLDAADKRLYAVKAARKQPRGAAVKRAG